LSHLLSKLPASRLADWGYNVSVCIAVACEDGKKIVMVNDMKASFPDFSADAIGQKNQPFFHKWVALFAGNDVEYVPTILERAGDKLQNNMNKTKKEPSAKEVGEAVQAAWWEMLDDIIESSVLRRHKFTLRTFLRDGKQKCTASIYNGLRSRIEQAKLSLQFLVCGFDGKGEGHVLVVDGKHPPGRYDSIGIWAIGSGAPSALSALMFHSEYHGLNRYSQLPKAVYCALDAKFMAESATDVGKKGTFVMVLDETGTGVQYIREAHFAAIRELWETQGAPRIPPDALTEISNSLFKITTEMIANWEKTKNS
jgi:ATP-dependent protease HslVU (ClpYQ) peptidase subunit